MTHKIRCWLLRKIAGEMVVIINVDFRMSNAEFCSKVHFNTNSNIYVECTVEHE